MGLSAEAIVRLTGVIIAIPSTALVVWICLRMRKIRGGLSKKYCEKSTTNHFSV